MADPMLVREGAVGKVHPSMVAPGPIIIFVTGQEKYAHDVSERGCSHVTVMLQQEIQIKLCDEKERRECI